MKKLIHALLLTFALTFLMAATHDHGTPKGEDHSGCVTESIKFDDQPSDLIDMHKVTDGYSWYKVTGDTAWKLYRDGLRRDELPFIATPLPPNIVESKDHLIIVDVVNKFVFVLEVTA